MDETDVTYVDDEQLTIMTMMIILMMIMIITMIAMLITMMI